MQIFEVFGDIVLRDHNIESRLNRIDDAVNRAQAGIQQFGANIMQIGSNMMSFGNMLFENVSKPILNVAKDSVMLASDLQESFNVVNQTFGKSANEVIKWSTTLLDKYGMVQLESINYVGSMGAMLKSSGLNAKASKNMSERLVELTGDMSSFYNLSHEETWEKIRSGISGETEPLKSLGINMSVANLEAYALSKGIKKSWVEMDQAQQVTLRYGYLMKVTKDAQGDFARTSDGFANKLRILQGQWTNLKTTIGNQLLPVADRALDFFMKLKNQVADIPGIGKIAAAIAALGVVIGPVIIIIGGMVTAVGGLIAIISLIGAPVAATIAAIGALIPVFLAIQGAAIYVWYKIGLLQQAFNLLKSAIQFVSLMIKGEAVNAMNLLTEKFGLTQANAALFIQKINSARNAVMKVGIVVKDTAALILQIFGNKQKATINSLVKNFGMSKKEALEFAAKVLRAKDEAVNLAKKIRDTVVGALSEFMGNVKRASKFIYDHRIEIARAIGKIVDFGSKTMSIMSKILSGASKANQFGKKVAAYIIAGVTKSIASFNKMKNSASSTLGKIISFCVNVKRGFDNIVGSIGRVIGKIASIKFPSPPSWLPGFASGVTNFRGGMALVGEKGPEIVQLPRGSNVIPSNRIQQVVNKIKNQLLMPPIQEKSSGYASTGNIILNMYNNVYSDVDIDNMMNKVVNTLKGNRVLKNE